MTNSKHESAGQKPAGQRAVCGPRVSAVQIRIDQPVESHGRAPGPKHRQDNPKSGFQPGKPRAARNAPRKAKGIAKTVCSNLIISRTMNSLFMKRNAGIIAQAGNRVDGDIETPAA